MDQESYKEKEEKRIVTMKTKQAEIGRGSGFAHIYLQNVKG